MPALLSRQCISPASEPRRRPWPSSFWQVLSNPKKSFIYLFIFLETKGSQLEYQAPLINPISMIPCPPPPSEVAPGRVFEYAAIGVELAKQLSSGDFSDATVQCSDGSIPVHKVVLVAAGAEQLMNSQLPVTCAQARILLHFLYAGHVGQALMQGAAASREVKKRKKKKKWNIFLIFFFCNKKRFWSKTLLCCRG